MTAFTDYLVPETIDAVRSKLRGYLVAAGSLITDWILGSVGQQTAEGFAQALWQASAEVSSLVQGYASLDTSADPGDKNPYDPENEGLPPGPGYLSQKGEGDFGTPRNEETFATGQVTLTNGYSAAVSFAVGALTFTSSGTDNPTYRNVAGSPYDKVGGGTLAANPDGSVTVPAGIAIYLPVQAEVKGIASNAGPGLLSLTTTLAPTGVTATNAASILATAREAADPYRERCRQAASLTSPNGPADSYRYLATSARDDGTWGNSKTGNPIGITRVYVNEASSTGIVEVSIAKRTGGVSAISTDELAIVDDIIRTNPGVIAVPNAITISIARATDTTINLTYTVKGKASLVPKGATPGTYTTGGSPPDNVQAVFDAIEANVIDYLASVDIGGNDQTSGAGFIYTSDLGTAIVTTTMNNVSIGLYDQDVTTPSASSTSIAAGHDGILGSVDGTLILV